MTKAELVEAVAEQTRLTKKSAAELIDVVFDNIGGATLLQSWKLLAAKGTLVSYAISSSLHGSDSVFLSFVRLLTRLTVWNALPNGRRASFYNVRER